MKKQTREKMRLHRKGRVRAKISGTAVCPRLAVFRSLKNISVQAIDDQSGRTLAVADLRALKGMGNTVEGAAKVGEMIAEKCAALKITEAVFDRAGYRYHGRVKAVAEGARSGGLKF